MTAGKPIIDCHVNIWNKDNFSRRYYESLQRVRHGELQQATDADAIYRAMEAVDRAIIFSPRYNDSAGVQGDDEITAAAVRKYPEKFVGFAYVDPRETDCVERLQHSVEKLGLKGVKYGPIYNGVPLDDERLFPVYDYCQKMDIPITMHMGTTFSRNAPIDLGRAIHVEPVAQRWPDLKLIMAHMGHPWFEECIAVARKQPNVYAEISALFYRPWQFYNMLITAQEYKMVDKIFFGTDFPFSTVEESIEGLTGANHLVEGTNLPKVSDETIDTILYSNPFEHWWHTAPLTL